MVENKLSFADNKWTGYAMIKGHYVEDRKELYDLKAAKSHPHEELKIEGSQIKKLDNYGPWIKPYTAINFTLTVLNALPVMGGALVMGSFWGPGAKMWE